MKKRLSEPVALIALGAGIAVLALLGYAVDPQSAGMLLGLGLAMVLAGGAWWLLRGHVQEFQRKRAERQSSD